MTILVLCTTSARLAWLLADRAQALLVDYLRESKATDVQIGVVIFGRASEAVSPLRTVDMLVATTAWESRTHGVTSRAPAVLGARFGRAMQVHPDCAWEGAYGTLNSCWYQNAFISNPQPTKAMYDAVQEMHPKTFIICFLL